MFRDFGPGAREPARQGACVFPSRMLWDCGADGGGVSAGRLPGRDQANWTISTGRLSALPRVHLRPIDVVVFHGPDGETWFRGGLPA